MSKTKTKTNKKTNGRDWRSASSKERAEERSRRVQACLDAVRRKAEVAGINISAYQIHGATLDQTWGDKVGYVIEGPEPSVAQRIAECLVKCLSSMKLSEVTSYDCQHAVGLCDRLLTVSVLDPGPSDSWEDKFRRRTVTGPAVGLFYYPCAD